MKLQYPDRRKQSSLRFHYDQCIFISLTITKYPDPRHLYLLQFSPLSLIQDLSIGYCSNV
jgi:hypothetical protein